MGVESTRSRQTASGPALLKDCSAAATSASGRVSVPNRFSLSRRCLPTEWRTCHRARWATLLGHRPVNTGAPCQPKTTTAFTRADVQRKGAPPVDSLAPWQAVDDRLRRAHRDRVPLLFSARPLIAIRRASRRSSTLANRCTACAVLGRTLRSARTQRGLPLLSASPPARPRRPDRCASVAQGSPRASGRRPRPGSDRPAGCVPS